MRQKASSPSADRSAVTNQPRLWPLSLLLIQSLLLLVAACSGGGGGTEGPATPTQPNEPPASISGLWIGTGTSDSASGTCLADDFQAVTVPVTWSISQQGSSGTATLTVPTGNFFSCSYFIAISGSRFSLSYDPSNSSFCSPDETSVCKSGQRVHWQEETNHLRISGNVYGDTITTTADAVFKVTDPDSGEYLGEFVVHQVGTIHRQ
jgi:hypothetical protein